MEVWHSVPQGIAHVAEADRYRQYGSLECKGTHAPHFLVPSTDGTCRISMLDQ